MDDENVLEVINKITEFNDLKEFMNDSDLDEALEWTIKLIMKPSTAKPGEAQKLIVKLQAMSTKFALLAAYYTTIGRDKAGTVNNHKKNIYYTLREALDKLVDSLKYMAKI